ncbi:MAG: ABC transporter ATP-binding protein [Clostridia bacterium]
MSNSAVKMTKITKRFGSVVANIDVDFEILKGEVISLLGENGSGKTTLMNMLAGIYYPDEGEIYIEDKLVAIKSPKDAFDNGIGMIHQHFKLIDVFTAAENIALGLEEKGKLDLKKIGAKITEICDKYGFEIDPEQKVYSMSVSQKQTLEIVKALYRGANTLILDEPTAVLTPQETEKLFAIINNMKADQKSIIIITHKLHEVLRISDKVVVLRKGAYVDTMLTKDATTSSLTEMMVGEKVELDIQRTTPKNLVKRLEVRNLTCYNKDGVLALDNINFDAFGGEILGITGISGCGQKELLEAVAGLQFTDLDSSVKYYPENTTDEMQLIGKTPKQIRNLGVSLSFVPEDRLGMGLVGTMGMTGNMMLKDYSKGKSFFTSKKEPKKLATKIKNELEVATPDIETPVRRLSGGNVQKVLVGREIAAAPTVLMTAYAVRGLDIHSSYAIYNLLNEQKEKGVAVIYVGEDLDVLVELADRILVLCAGKLNGIVDARTTTKEEIGLLMTHLEESEETK